MDGIANRQDAEHIECALNYVCSMERFDEEQRNEAVFRIIGEIQNRRGDELRRSDERSSVLRAAMENLNNMIAACLPQSETCCP